MDIAIISILAFLMQAVADSDLERSSPVRTEDTPDGSPSAFRFTVCDLESPMLSGEYRVTLERVGEPPRESALTIDSMEIIED